jgi:hypothetical protein
MQLTNVGDDPEQCKPPPTAASFSEKMQLSIIGEPPSTQDIPAPYSEYPFRTVTPRSTEVESSPDRKRKPLPTPWQ